MNKKSKNTKKSIKPSSKTSKRSSIPKSLAIYCMNSSKDIKYVRFRTVQDKDESIKVIITFVDKFKDASMFINTESAKKYIQVIQPRYPSYSFKYIDSTKV